MNRSFYSLPNPREASLKWRQYEQAREKVERIEQRLRETQRRQAEVEERIKHLGDAAVRELAQSILAGEDDPAARHEEHEKLVAELRELRLQGQATAEALPRAEEELRQTVYEHQHRWKEEADRALEKAIASERQAYDKARALIEEPRTKRLYAEELSKWVRYPQPTFGTSSDIAIPTAIQPLQSSAERAEQQMQERLENEALQLEALEQAKLGNLEQQGEVA